MSDSTTFPDEIPEGYKRCTKCGEVKPFTSGFSRQKRNISGYRSICKNCQREYNRQWKKSNPDKKRENARRYRAARKEQIRDYRRRKYAENLEINRERQRRSYWKNPEKKREYRHNYRLQNIDRHREYKRRQRDLHPERHRAEEKRRYARHPEKFKKYFINRRAKIKGLPSGFTFDDEQRALNYWHGCCAVCGNPLRDLFGEHTYHLDHWIAISDPRPDNPGTVSENMLPLCSKCNLAKSSFDPIEWLTKIYGPHKAKQIAARIEAFFEWVRDQR